MDRVDASPATLDHRRLAAVLGMLGSQHDGEVLAAAKPLLVPAGLSHRPGLLSRKARKGRTARKPREAGSSLTENPVDDLWREGVP